MKPLFSIVLLLLLMAVVAAALFGIQSLGLPKMVVSALAAILMLAMVFAAKPIIEDLNQEKDVQKPTRHCS